MVDTFTWRVHATASGRGQFDVRRSKFGDGYEQRVPVGLNNGFQTWNVTVSGYDIAGADGIRRPLEFLESKDGAESFYWTPPLGTRKRWTCERYDIVPQGGGYYTINAEFVQAFGP